VPAQAVPGVKGCCAAACAPAAEVPPRCEGELDEGFWVPYEEYAAGWDGRAHWVDFHGTRRRPAGKRGGASVH
jgi:hypothetical protein